MAAKTLSKSINGNGKDKSLETWIWDAAYSIRGAQDAAKYKDFILPLIFAKRLCDVFDDELNKVAENVGSRAKAIALTTELKKALMQKLFTEGTRNEPQKMTAIAWFGKVVRRDFRRFHRMIFSFDHSNGIVVQSLL